MASEPLLFQSEKDAAALIAGIPLAARAVMALARDQRDGGPRDLIVLEAPGGWHDSTALANEIARLCPLAGTKFSTFQGVSGTPVLDPLTVITTGNAAEPRPAHAVLKRDPRDVAIALETEARTVLLRTGKATDGLVSRWINRPISRFLSHHLLKWRGVRPLHATIATALIALVMAFALVMGGEVGLVAGAVLFQLASIVDGVDGEIARATLRTSKAGASLDTAIDAATNAAFIAGVSANIWQQGYRDAALAGWAGLALMAIGLGLIGARSLASGGPLSFDALKHQASASGSAVLAVLGKLTSRDVYALVLALAIIAGFAAAAMIAFAIAAATWFVAAMIMLAKAGGPETRGR
ncbi:CDP-alcohol phosphatidyltransferase family protein [Qipengyuania nanhaisediminis]|uniref:CDP-alcohol phosphatidyltransferase family protein n=1 Tax=Qipengyuania nanhaisediminis TaxID=604088 RepID=UPI0038B2ABC0